MVQISQKTKQEIESKFTKYEIARILGARALQLAMNAPVLFKLSKEELEEIKYGASKIAEIEFYNGVLPITVKRPLPPKTDEKIIPKEKPKEEKPEEKPEEQKKQEEEKKTEEATRIKEEEEKKKEEEKIIKEAQESEIMEMAKPEDEAEEDTAKRREE